MAYDPRQPRPNPELADILRCIESSYRDFKASHKHNEKRGHAMVLRAHLECFLDEPESFTDLREGTVQTDHLIALSDIQTSGIHPFEAGDDSNRFFYYANGRISALYPGDPRDPYLVVELHRHGPFVHTLECLAVYGQATTNHLSSPECLSRLAGRSKEHSKDADFWVLAEPCGVWPGNAAPLARTYARRSSAAKLAQRLAAELEIRFMVARRRLSFCTR